MGNEVEQTEKIVFSEEEILRLVENYEKQNAQKGADKAELHDKACECVIKEVYAQLGISEEYLKEQLELINSLKNKNKSTKDDSFNADYEKQKQAVLSATGNAKSSAMDVVETGVELVSETGKLVVLALGGIEIVAPAVLGTTAYATITAAITAITAAPLFGPAVLAAAVGTLLFKFGKKAKTAKVNKAVEGKSVCELEEDFLKMLEQLNQVKDLLERDSDYIIKQYSMYQEGSITQEDFDSITKSYTTNVLAELGIGPKKKVNKSALGVKPAGTKEKQASKKPATKTTAKSKKAVSPAKSKETPKQEVAKKPEESNKDLDADKTTVEIEMMQ